MEPTLSFPTASHDIPCGPSIKSRVWKWVFHSALQGFANLRWALAIQAPCHVWLDLGNISYRPIKDPHVKVVGSYFMSTFCTSWLITEVRWALETPLGKAAKLSCTRYPTGRSVDKWTPEHKPFYASWKIYIPTYDKVKSRTHFFFFFEWLKSGSPGDLVYWPLYRGWKTSQVPSFQSSVSIPDQVSFKNIGYISHHLLIY